MLTSISWVPHGGMRAVPIHTEETVEEQRARVRRTLGGEAPNEGASGLEGEEGGEGGIDDIESDEDDANDPSAVIFGSKAGGNVVCEIESEDEDEIDDITFRPTDLVFMTARAEENEPTLELFVYDEVSDNMYLHHDVPLGAFPLCTTWLTDQAVSVCAVGSMLPAIELWNMDVIDAVEPAARLGGCANPDDNHRRRTTKKEQLLAPGSHKDAVLSVKWNTLAQHVLASGSADRTVKFWDLNQLVCVGTLATDEKAQTLDWHPSEANLLLSGTLGGALALTDCRRPTEASVSFAAGEGLEHVEWGFVEHQLMASTAGGELWGLDARSLSKGPVWRVEAHTKETTFSCSRQIPGLVATGGKDGRTRLWDVRSRTTAQPLANKKVGVGATFSMEFHPNNPHVLAACGSKGKPLIYTVDQDIKGVFS